MEDMSGLVWVLMAQELAAAGVPFEVVPAVGSELKVYWTWR